MSGAVRVMGVKRGVCVTAGKEQQKGVTGECCRRRSAELRPASEETRGGRKLAGFRGEATYHHGLASAARCRRRRSPDGSRLRPPQAPLQAGPRLEPVNPRPCNPSRVRSSRSAPGRTSGGMHATRRTCAWASPGRWTTSHAMCPAVLRLPPSLCGSLIFQGAGLPEGGSSRRRLCLFCS